MAPKKQKNAQATTTKHSAAPQPTDETAKQELDDAQLDDVSGGAGKVAMTDFSFVTKVDKSSPT
jgi:type VI protein secretion system component Hcp